NGKEGASVSKPFYIPKVASARNFHDEASRDAGASSARTGTSRGIYSRRHLLSHFSANGRRPMRLRNLSLTLRGKITPQWILEEDIKGCLDTHSQCTPSVDCRSKRPGRASGTWIFKPFRRPNRTRTASSSPRFTRCNTVWRETPSMCV